MWLYAVALLVLIMVVVGGATRLTDSGLSITEWKPILGAIPPLSDADWQDAFAKYREIPEYQLVNRGMSLDEFKFIFWWEWGHRFLGRFIGIAFALPMIFFWVTGRLERSLRPKLIALFVLGGLQGAMGWFMVMSGLVERVDVSQYRLAAHLSLAAVIFAALIWVALGIGAERKRANRIGPLALILLIFVQIAAGGLVAGLDAGMSYNTWPLMDGDFIPEGLFDQSPLWTNFFENLITVQFQHRMLAYLVAIAVADEAIRSLRHDELTRPAGWALVLTTIVQIVLGIATLLAIVPLSLALLHQVGAFVLLAAAVWNLHRWRQSAALA
jgi:cytochrome c oxidase assembly protein subunit 15